MMIIFSKVSNLKKHFPISSGIVFQRQVGAVRAVDGISFHVVRGETLGLVGESGCGKSTTGRTILQLYRPTEGSVKFEGHELSTMSGNELRQMRRRMQIIFQDPFASLNPRMTVGSIVSEPLQIHKIYSNKKERQQFVEELMMKVGLNPYFINRYPHEFSGGQRQRMRDRPCPGAGTELYRRRRTDLGTGCFDSGASGQFDGRAARRAWLDLSVHRALT